MNPDYHSPEDPNRVGRSAQIELQLKQLQPRPATFDAQSILNAAREAEQAILPELTGRKRNDRSSGWLTISAAFACGAIAGAVLTCLLLLPGIERDTAATNDGKQERHSSVVDKDENDIPRIIVDAPLICLPTSSKTRAADRLPSGWPNCSMCQTTQAVFAANDFWF